jgi:hypothetical protein
MGDSDPEIARENSPNSLRALYGISRQQNGLMGSTDAQIADMQISSLFASSPPFSTTELPENGQYDSVRSVSSSVLSALRRRNASDDGYAPSNPSTVGGSKNSTGKVPFRARSLPKTHEAPDIVPRSTRAAALRAGVVPEISSTAPRAPLSKARLKETFANVPGHKRTDTIAVASTAPPVVAPRMTRAASLRLGQPTQPAQQKRRPTSAIIGPARSADPSTFVGVPGHKRRESIAVASVKAPTVAPRTNKSAALRASKDAAPPTSFMCTLSVLSPRHKLTSHLQSRLPQHQSYQGWPGATRKPRLTSRINTTRDPVPDPEPRSTGPLVPLPPLLLVRASTVSTLRHSRPLHQSNHLRFHT